MKNPPLKYTFKIPAGAVVTCSRTELSVAIIVTFLLTVILYTSIIFVTYFIHRRYDEGIKKEKKE